MAESTAGSPRRAKLPREVVALGWVSYFTDVSSEMIVPLLPLFLTSLGAGAMALGLVEGLADTIASLLKLFSGRWADRAGRCRPFVVAGYALSSFARPWMALAAAPWHVVLVRAIDRTGKGIRTSPRDAMIAASTSAGNRGAAYGFHRAMDHAGAMTGPLLAVIVLQFWTRDLRTIFALAAIPAAAAVAVLLLAVRERAVPAGSAAKGVELPWRSSMPDGPLLRLLLPLALFTLGNSSDLFILLNVGEHGSGPIELSFLWIGLHAVKSIVSLKSGPIADRIGPARLVLGGWIVYAAVYVGLAYATGKAAILGLCLVYGAYHGLTEGSEKALVAAIAPADRRGAFFGWYHLTVGALALPASLLFGAVWSARGHSAAFLLGAGLALAACVALAVLRPGRAGLPASDG